MNKEKNHKYVISGEHYYSILIKSIFVESTEQNKKNALNIYWISDGPSNYDIYKFIKEVWTELDHLEIDHIYHDAHSGWLSDDEYSCFQIITVFFKN